LTLPYLVAVTLAAGFVYFDIFDAVIFHNSRGLLLSRFCFTLKHIFCLQFCIANSALTGFKTQLTIFAQRCRVTQ